MISYNHPLGISQYYDEKVQRNNDNAQYPLQTLSPPRLRTTVDAMNEIK